MNETDESVVRYDLIFTKDDLIRMVDRLLASSREDRAFVKRERERLRGEIARLRAEVERLKATVAASEQKTREVVDRAVETICLCDKHADIKWDEFVRLHHCPICCAIASRPDAAEELRGLRKDYEWSQASLELAAKTCGILRTDNEQLQREVERLKSAQSPPGPAAMVRGVSGDWDAFEDGGDARRFRNTLGLLVYELVTVRNWTWHPASRPDAAGDGLEGGANS